MKRISHYLSIALAFIFMTCTLCSIYGVFAVADEDTQPDTVYLDPADFAEIVPAEGSVETDGNYGVAYTWQQGQASGDIAFRWVLQNLDPAYKYLIVSIKSLPRAGAAVNLCLNDKLFSTEAFNGLLIDSGSISGVMKNSIYCLDMSKLLTEWPGAIRLDARGFGYQAGDKLEFNYFAVSKTPVDQQVMLDPRNASLPVDAAIADETADGGFSCKINSIPAGHFNFLRWNMTLNADVFKYITVAVKSTPDAEGGALIPGFGDGNFFTGGNLINQRIVRNVKDTVFLLDMKANGYTGIRTPFFQLIPEGPFSTAGENSKITYDYIAVSTSAEIIPAGDNKGPSMGGPGGDSSEAPPSSQEPSQEPSSSEAPPQESSQGSSQEPSSNVTLVPKLIDLKFADAKVSDNVAASATADGFKMFIDPAQSGIYKNTGNVSWDLEVDFSKLEKLHVDLKANNTAYFLDIIIKNAEGTPVDALSYSTYINGQPKEYTYDILSDIKAKNEGYLNGTWKITVRIWADDGGNKDANLYNTFGRIYFETNEMVPQESSSKDEIPLVPKLIDLKFADAKADGNVVATAVDGGFKMYINPAQTGIYKNVGKVVWSVKQDLGKLVKLHVNLKENHTAFFVIIIIKNAEGSPVDSIAFTEYIDGQPKEHVFDIAAKLKTMSAGYSSGEWDIDVQICADDGGNKDANLYNTFGRIYFETNEMIPDPGYVPPHTGGANLALPLALLTVVAAGAAAVTGRRQKKEP